jgi:hypothetical protein
VYQVLDGRQQKNETKRKRGQEKIMVAAGLGDIEKRITAILEWKVLGERNAKEFRDEANRLGITTEELQQNLLESEKAFKKEQSAIEKNTDAKKKQANIDTEQLSLNEQLMNQRGKIVASFLSLLFAGQALQRATGNLLSTSMEWVGINEIISFTMGDLFLPIVLALLEPLLELMDYFMGLSDTTKLVIGGVVLFLFFLGALVAFISQAMLTLVGLEIVAGLVKTSFFKMGEAAATSGSIISGWTFGGILTGLAKLAGWLLVVWALFHVGKGFVKQLGEEFPELQMLIDKIDFDKIITSVIFMAGLFEMAGRLIAVAMLNMMDTLAGIGLGITGVIVRMVEDVVNALIRGYDVAMKLIGRDGSGIDFDLKSDKAFGMSANYFGRVGDRTRGFVAKTPTFGELMSGHGDRNFIDPNLGNTVDYGSMLNSAQGGGGNQIINNFNGYAIEEVVRKVEKMAQTKMDEIEGLK